MTKIFIGTFEIRDIFSLSTGNWFVPCYIGLLLLSPVLNVFVGKTSQSEQKGVILSLIIFQTWFGWIPAFPTYIDFNEGYSIASFVIIYLLARYFRMFGLPLWIKKWSMVLYIFSSLLIWAIALIQDKLLLPIKMPMFAHSNPLVIFSAICFFTSFEKLRIKDGKLINYLASSTLAVLLIHEPYPFHTYMKQSFCYVRDNFSGFERCCLWLLCIIAVYVFCLVLDQIRILTYKPIKKKFNL